MSLYADYKKEREGKFVQEDDRYFASYSIDNDLKIIYIEELYVKPEFRRTGLLEQLDKEMIKYAKSIGMTRMMGSIVPSAKSSQISLLVLIKRGFKILSSREDIVYFIKEL